MDGAPYTPMGGAPYAPMGGGVPPHVFETMYKKSVRRANMVIFFLLMGFYLIQIIVSSVIMLTEMFMNGSAQELVLGVANGDMVDSNAIMDAASDMSASAGLASLLSMAAALPLFLVLRKGRLFTADLIEKRETIRPGLFVKLFIVAMGAQFIFSLISTIIEQILGIFGVSASALYETSMDALLTPTGLLYAMLLGPIMEEIIFRGAIMKHLEQFGANYAIVISSLLFGLYHVFVYQAAFAFLVGLILAYTAHRYAIRYAMLLHILINSTALALQGLETWGNSTFASAGVGLFIIALFIAAIVLFVRNRNLVKMQAAVGKPVMPKTFRYAFSGGFMILLFIIFAAVNIRMMTPIA
jgi:membrane protease YdiL (CAAX protease family)